MTISEIIGILLSLDEIRSEGYIDAADILLDLTVVEGHDFPGDQPPGTIRIQGGIPRSLTEADEINAPYILVDSTPHIPQLHLYTMMSLDEVEAHILGPSVLLNRFCGSCVVIKDRLPLRFRIHLQDHRGEQAALPKARIQWLD